MQTRSTRVHGDETPAPSSAWTSAFAAGPVPQPRTRRGRSTREFCRRSRPTSRSGCDLLQSCEMRSAGERPPAHGQGRPDAPARPLQRPTYPAGRQWSRSHRGRGSIDRLARGEPEPSFLSARRIDNGTGRKVKGLSDNSVTFVRRRGRFNRFSCGDGRSRCRPGHRDQESSPVRSSSSAITLRLQHSPVHRRRLA
jgi:hypothetical protein